MIVNTDLSAFKLSAMLYLVLNCLQIRINVYKTPRGRSSANVPAPEAVTHVPELLVQAAGREAEFALS